jgi:DNA polymerase-3 subunit delta
MAKSVYALVGPDSFLQLQELGAIARELGKDTQRVDIEGDKAELADVLDEVRSFAMFGSGKLVVVRNADGLLERFKEQLEDYVSNPSDSATLVLRFDSLPGNLRVAKAIAKAGEVRKCEPPKDVESWIINRGKTVHKITIGMDGARILRDLIGDDLGKLDNELAKLALQSDSGKVIAGEIAQGVVFQREQEMWDFTNALAAGDTAEAIKRWRHLLQMDPSGEYRAVTWLGMWLENVRKALANKKKGVHISAYAKSMRLWNPQQQQSFMKTAESIGEEGAARALELLVEVDRQSKSGIGAAAENVERFILAVGVGSGT